MVAVGVMAVVEVVVVVVTCHPEHVGYGGVGPVDESIENEVTDGWRTVQVFFPR